jgi:YD repeat-containing protein
VFAYTYDMLGRRTAVNDPDLGYWRYTYDDAGRLTERTDAAWQKVRFTYDAAGRTLTKTTRHGTASAETVRNTYDEPRGTAKNIGSLTTLTSTAARVETDHDITGRVIAQRTIVPGPSGTSATHTQTTAYDASGRVTARTFPDGDVSVRRVPPC